MMAISWWVGALAMISGFLPSLDKFCNNAQMRCSGLMMPKNLPLVRLCPNALGQARGNGLNGRRVGKNQTPHFSGRHHHHLRLFVGDDHLGRGQAVEHRDLAKVLAFFNKVKAYFAAIQRKINGLQPAFKQKHQAGRGLFFGQHHSRLANASVLECAASWANASAGNRRIRANCCKSEG